MIMQQRVVPFEQLRMRDVEHVGGKNASLGEMIGNLAALGVSVPGGFATTAHAFREFVDQSGLKARIFAKLATLDTEDVAALAVAGAEIRGWVTDAPLHPELDQDIRSAYRRLCEENGGDIAVAVRSSATAEVRPTKSSARIPKRSKWLGARKTSARLTPRSRRRRAKPKPPTRRSGRDPGPPPRLCTTTHPARPAWWRAVGR